MKEIKPILNIDASIAISASKSYANRALAISALAGGTSFLKNISKCDDTLFMIDGLKRLGVNISEDGDTLVVQGTEGNIVPRDNELFLGNAGTAVRFLTTFAILSKNKIIIRGDERMNERPIQDLIDAISQTGSTVYSLNSNGCPPIVIQGGNFIGGEISISGKNSSQYLSSMLMCAPYAENPVTIKIKGELTSRPYIDMTIDIMKHFGGEVKNSGYREFTIDNKKRYTGKRYSIEADASGASYFFAAAAITGGRVRVTNLGKGSLQGDINFVKILEKMGCAADINDDYIEVTGKALKGIDADMGELPDVVQTLAIVALFAKGKTRISNAANLRIKETDRLKALYNELTRVGGEVEETADGLIINGGRKLKGAEIETYNDHRMAMSFSVLGLAVAGIVIKNPDCVNKSFPSFFEKLEELRQR